ncbi:AEC family transporter [Pokkaliibacter sp. CJK22405]|uniref:AEC family transporter n=1 Tax=Pokkaliibacter sp. CJK22405 TaxID=3384615 RepID=UPI0039856404
MTLVNTLIPVFALIGLGLFSRHINLFRAEAAASFNTFILYICLPPLFFWSTASVRLEEIANFRYISVILIGALVTGTLAWWLIGRMQQQIPSANRLLLSLSALNPNTIYIGVPLFTLLFGPQGTLPIIIASLCFNLLMGIAMTILDMLTQSSRFSLGTVLYRLFIKNPLFLPPLIGIAWNILQLPEPKALASTMTLLSQATAPVALFTMGLTLYGQRVRGQMKQLLLLTGLKLAVQPIIIIGLCTFLLPLPAPWYESAILASAMPTAAMVSVFALRYEKEIAPISSTIVISTLLAIPALSLWMLLLPHIT